MKKRTPAKHVIEKIKNKIIVECPSCHTQFFREKPSPEFCNICETDVIYIKAK